MATGSSLTQNHSRSQKGRESIENEPRSGRPSVSKTAENVVRVRDLVRSDRRLTVRMIGEELNLNYTTVHQILTNELKTRKICAKMVQKNLYQWTVSRPILKDPLKGSHQAIDRSGLIPASVDGEAWAARNVTGVQGSFTCSFEEPVWSQI
ncbi:HTH_48 domain-containing protein [Trichonephila clavipes]|nr:HTH_48 domain-containing protein [Trichonephila clavipes]